MRWNLTYTKILVSGPLAGMSLPCSVIYPDRASAVGPRDRLAEASNTQEELTDCVGAPFRVQRDSVRLKQVR